MRSGILIGILALAATSACGPAAPPNVLLIVVDTLRFDHLGCYGHPRDTSPAIDAFAAGAVRFQRAYATAPWTQPSVASIMTGLHPSAHGADRVERTLGPALRTLAEILHERGWATAGVVSHTMLGSKRGFSQGFEVYREEDARGHGTASTPAVTDKAVELLGRLAGDERPFFLFVHYFDPHYTFLRHPEFGFAGSGAGRLRGGEDIHALRALLDDLGEDEIAFLRDLYDEEIRFTDQGVARLLAELRERGLERDTLVVLTADHGEEFLERGWLGHTRSLHEELVRVPLLLRPAGAAPRARVVSRAVSLVSLAPTILELAGIDPSEFAFQGESLARLIREGAMTGPGAVFAEVDYHPTGEEEPIKGTHEQAVVVDHWKLIRDARSGAVALYDLESDPAERVNLAPARPELTQRLRSALEDAALAAREGSIPPDVRALSEDERDLLRGLGYVGPRAPPAPRTRSAPVE